MKRILLTLVLGVLISANGFSQEKLTWHTNVNSAFELAIKENKKVMLFFTGSDWCGWCIKLQNEVFKTPDFEKWSNDLVLVELDFPRRTAQEEAIKMQNRQLQSIFKVRGYPSVYFVVPEKMPDGKMNLNSLGKTGYVRGGATKWLEVANSIVNKTI
ncbi:thioredoxin family protein [Algibacter pectinivorans]|uniref:Thioredoxin-like n=1 Tax=Algibacter pectinivorans TaxID=870482 RepID=A0A1I1Q769_9FLAO|nr:thioredoxin family protein [Algibacter pectinivorans]SFD15063.1 Thioredoxin-like [Algibacter pectinivorans]